MVRKRSKRTLLLTLAIGFAITFVTLVGLRIYFEFNPTYISVPETFYVLTPDKTNVKVGDKVYVPVYLKGIGVNKVTAFDVKLYFDSSKLELTEALPGDFFKKYLTVKWDKESAWFALTQYPFLPNLGLEANSPLAILEFTAIDKSASTLISTGTSKVYLTKIGEHHPITGTAYIKIK